MSVAPPTALTANIADTRAARQERLAAVSLAKGGNAKALASLSQAQQVKSVSGQFEAILLRQFLQDSVGKIMGGESAGPSGNIYGYMLTDVLASKISEGGGLGLASVIQKQLSPRAAPTAGAQKPTP
jgi:flagellar protein FlgJ